MTDNADKPKKKPGPPKGSYYGNAGKGRPKKESPFDYSPRRETVLRRLEAKELFADEEVFLAADTLVDGVRGFATRDRIAAAKEVLDRVYGRPAQQIQIYGDDTKDPVRVDSGVLKTYSTDELVQAARVLLAAKGEGGHE